MRIASSTAWRLSTGSAPGSPSVTGSMFVLGSSPNRLGEAENSFVAVASSTWTSSPTTSSYAVEARLGWWSVTVIWLASSRTLATRNMTGSPSVGASTWTPTGRPSAPVPNGTLIAGSPDRLDGIVYVSQRYMASGLSVLSPIGNATVGDVGVISTSASW